MWAGQQCTSSTTGVDGDSETGCVRRFGRLPGKVCGVPESEVWARKAGRHSVVERNKVKVGTDPGLPLLPHCRCSGRAGSGADRRGSGRSLRRTCKVGVACHTGEGRQRVSSGGIGMPGRSPVNTGASSPTLEEASVRVLEHLNQAASLVDTSRPVESRMR